MRLFFRRLDQLIKFELMMGTEDVHDIPMATMKFAQQVQAVLPSFTIVLHDRVEKAGTLWTV
jgi:hypothetical protein